MLDSAARTTSRRGTTSHFPLTIASDGFSTPRGGGEQILTVKIQLMKATRGGGGTPRHHHAACTRW
jgi:hypothetical protein